MGLGLQCFKPPYDSFDFALVEKGRGTLEAVIQQSLQTPTESVSGNRNVYVSSWAAEIITLKISEK
jgi:hypothetical protein